MLIMLYASTKHMAMARFLNAAYIEGTPHACMSGALGALETNTHFVTFGGNAWEFFTYGAKPWKSTSIDDPELCKLTHLFQRLQYDLDDECNDYEGSQFTDSPESVSIWSESPESEAY